MADNYVTDITITLTPSEALLVLYALENPKNYNPKDRQSADRVRIKIYDKVRECDNNG